MASAWGNSWKLSWLNSWGKASTPQPDSHDGGGYIPEHLYKWWKKQHEKKKPTIAEVIEAVQDYPQEAIKAVPQVKREFKSVDYDAVANNAKIAEFIARQLLIQFELKRIEEEDENDAIFMLLLT